jgi:hypothetical protein
MSKLLRARGIQGVILSPRLPTPGPMPDLEWEHFSPVALGFSITNLTIHRVCTYHTHNMRLCLGQMRTHGYRRVGLVLPREIYERSRGHVLGAYMAEQCLLPDDERVDPALRALGADHQGRGRQVAARPADGRRDPQRHAARDAGVHPRTGLRRAGRTGRRLISRFGKTGIAGIDERMRLLGEGAVEAVVGMISRNEKGLPTHPHYTLIEGSWVERPTVRPLPA